MKKRSCESRTSQRLGILGGSFNPVHLGHIRIAKAAAKLLSAQTVLLITAADPPHKVLPEKSPSAQKRHELIRKCEDSVLKACDIELSVEGKCYTVDTLKKLKEIYKDAKFYLIMGTDMFCMLEEWKDAPEIFKLSGICVFFREDCEREKAEEYALKLREKYSAEIIFSPLPPFEVSSTRVRELLKKNSTEVLKLLPEKVLKQIAQDSLYGCNRDFYKILLEAKHRISPKRFNHTLGVIGEAEKLALRYGADVQKCIIAAAIHDITKESSASEQMDIFQKYDKIPQGEDDRLPLYHALTGAILAEEEFKIHDPEIINAVKNHTTGRKDMTLCEKIIFLADFIEPARDFDGVKEARELSYQDIDKAVKYAARIVFDEVLSKGDKPHSDTAEAAGIVRSE